MRRLPPGGASHPRGAIRHQGMDRTPRPAHHAPAIAPDPAPPTLRALLAEVLDLGAGLTVMLLPFLGTALPGVVLVLVLPVALLALLAAVPAMLVAALVAPPYLLVRAARRRRRRPAPTRRRHAGPARER